MLPSWVRLNKHHPPLKLVWFRDNLFPIRAASKVNTKIVVKAGVHTFSSPSVGVFIAKLWEYCSKMHLERVYHTNRTSERGVIAEEFSRSKAEVTSLFQYIIMRIAERRDCYIRTLDSGEKTEAKRRVSFVSRCSIRSSQRNISYREYYQRGTLK
jgi:hypothetical protein